MNSFAVWRRRQVPAFHSAKERSDQEARAKKTMHSACLLSPALRLLFVFVFSPRRWSNGV